MTKYMRGLFSKRQLLVMAMIAFFGFALVVVPQVGAQNAPATPATTSACVRDGSASWRHPLRKVRQELRERHGNCDRVVIGEVSDLTGLTNKDIAKDLWQGQSLAEIAQGQGVARQDLIDGITQAVSARIDEGVAAGNIAPDQKQIWMDKLAANIDSIIDWHRVDHRDAAPSMGTPTA